MAVVLASLASVVLASAAILNEAYRSARSSTTAAHSTVMRSALIEISGRIQRAEAALASGRHEGFFAVVDDTLGDNRVETLGLRSQPIKSLAEPLEKLDLVTWSDDAGGSGLGVIGNFQGRRLRALLAADTFADLAVTFGDAEIHTNLLPRSGPSEPSDSGIRIEAGPTGAYQVSCEHPIAAGWVVRVEQPFSKAFTSIFALAARVFAIDCALLCLVGFGAYVFARRVVAPIEALTEDARRIARGTENLQIEERGSTWEVRVLSRSIRDMAAALFRHHTDLEAANQRLRSQNEELQTANEVLEQLSITDGLTKLHNHRFFQEQLSREIKRAERTGDALSILVCDIDDFKALNDKRGHKAGDDLLKGLARMLSESVRESDFLARYGGEEFVVLAAQTDVDGAIRLAEKIRAAVEEASFIMDGSPRPGRTTISVGVAQYRGSRAGFFRAADQALYRAKASGKNCVSAEDRDAP